MAYTSPYMTYAELIRWVSEREPCTPDEATRQIRTAVADNQLTGLRWDDQRSGATAVLDSRPDYPPDDRAYWRGDASIPDEQGRIFDPWTKQWRTLLFAKDSIFKHWPPPEIASAASTASESSETSDGSSNVVPIATAKVGRRSHKDEIYQTCDRLLEQGHRMMTMGATQAAVLVTRECGAGPKDEGWATSTVRKIFSAWRKERRDRS